MSRDHTKLRFFAIADQLVLDVYQLTQLLPDAERYGLQSQIRRAAVSAVTNVVEGCARRSDRSYLHFLEIALGSATEARYLLTLTARLRMLPPDRTQALNDRYSEVIKSTQSLINTVSEDLRRSRLKADS
jgi:four helix bundle protein